MAGLRDGIGSGGGSIGATSGTFSGNVTLGDASGDAITCTGTLTVTPTAVFTGGVTINNDSTIAAGKDLTIGTDGKLFFRDTGLYINSGANGKLTISADGTGADDLTIGCTITVSDNITMAADKDVILATTGQVQFRDTGLYIKSSADGVLDIVSDTTVAISGAVTADSTLAVTGAQTNTVGIQSAATARTPTADGTGDGLIADGTSIVNITSPASANYWITLPTPTPGNVLWILTESDATGFEIRTDTPASVSINGGADTNAESAIASTTVAVRCVCVSADYWLCSQFDADGDETKVTAAAA